MGKSWQRREIEEKQQKDCRVPFGFCPRGWSAGVASKSVGSTGEGASLLFGPEMQRRGFTCACLLRPRGWAPPPRWLRARAPNRDRHGLVLRTEATRSIPLFLAAGRPRESSSTRPPCGPPVGLFISRTRRRNLKVELRCASI